MQICVGWEPKETPMWEKLSAEGQEKLGDLVAKMRADLDNVATVEELVQQQDPHSMVLWGVICVVFVVRLG